jgi:hypothetical protein
MLYDQHPDNDFPRLEAISVNSSTKMGIASQRMPSKALSMRLDTPGGGFESDNYTRHTIMKP